MMAESDARYFAWLRKCVMDAEDTADALRAIAEFCEEAADHDRNEWDIAATALEMCAERWRKARTTVDKEVPDGR
jgi:hypothetical protein